MEPSTDQLLQITAPHFCAGVVLRADRVRDAAPIVKYMKGWTLAKVLAYAASKKWSVHDST